MYCTCNLSNPCFQRAFNGDMQTFGCQQTAPATVAQQPNGPTILKSCLTSANSHSCLPNILSQSQNQLHCSHLPHSNPSLHQSQNVTPWRYYCTCKTKCIYCTNTWWPTCPRLQASQSTANCFTQQQQQSLPSMNKENILNMSNGNCDSPALSASPVPAPPPPQPSRVCTRCRFTVPDNHIGQSTPNYGNLSNSYTGKIAQFQAKWERV